MEFHKEKIIKIIIMLPKIKKKIKLKIILKKDNYQLKIKKHK